MTRDLTLDHAAWPHPPKYVELGDGRLHYVDVGRGPVVLLVHGTPTWSFEWRHVIAALAATHRVVALDHLGFGLSSRPAAADYSPEAHARRFHEFIERCVGTGPVALVVHDFGGPIALDWAVSHPDRVRHLTIINSWMWSFDDDPLMQRRARLVKGALGRLLYRYANASLRLIMPSAYADRSRLTRAVHAQYLRVFPDADSRERVLFALARSLLDSGPYFASLWRRRAALTAVPMSVIWGLRDSAFGPAFLARWRDAFPHAQVSALEDAGHWPHEEQPDATVDALRRALGGAVAAPPGEPTPPQPTPDSRRVAPSA
jgi:haloalkane dehalogenase